MSAVRVVRFGRSTPQPEKGRPGRVVSGDPETTVQNYYSDRSGTFHSGVWESTPGKWQVNYAEDEFCAILQGTVILTDADGRAETFTAGDAFVIPAGFAGTWETVATVRKFYAIAERK